MVTCVDHASLTEELVAADGCWREESHFSLAMWPLVGCHALEDDPTLVGTWAALMGFSGFLGFGFKEEGRRGHEDGRGCLGRSWGPGEGE